MKICDQLRQLRLALGMTQAEMGRELGIPQQTYYNYEKGSREPPHSIIEKVILRFEVNEGWLVVGGTNPHIGRKLKESRELRYRGFKSEEVAIDLGISHKLLVAIEQGTIIPSDSLLTRMCLMYNVNKYQVLDEKILHVPARQSTGDDTLDWMITEYRNILDLLRQNPDQKDRIENYLRGTDTIAQESSVLSYDNAGEKRVIELLRKDPESVQDIIKLLEGRAARHRLL